MTPAFKRFCLKIYIFIWQLLRCIALVLVAGPAYYMFILITSPSAPDRDRPAPSKVVCGLISGQKIVVPRSYVVFWAEYEGASVWDKDMINNKRGCDANITSLPLVMTWPQLLPAKHFEYFGAQRFKGLDVAIRPVGEAFDLRRRLDALIGYAREEPVETPVYMEELGLYLVQGKDRTFPDAVNGYYWSEQNGRVEAIAECRGGSGGKGYMYCQVEFGLSELNALVEVSFTPEKFKDWRLIENSVSEFVLSNIER